MSHAVFVRRCLVALTLVVASASVAQSGDEGYRSLPQGGFETDPGQNDGDGAFDGGVPDYRAGRTVFLDGVSVDDGVPRYRWRGYDDGVPSNWRAPASVIVGSGRFSGNADAWYGSGGSYFTITRYDQAHAGQGVKAVRPVRSRVLTVGQAAVRRNDDACSFEAGVCVIRGR